MTDSTLCLVQRNQRDVRSSKNDRRHVDQKINRKQRLAHKQRRFEIEDDNEENEY